MAAAAGLAALTANLTGAGSVNANNTALADITASIVGYGEATSQGIRDAVWSAIASEFNAPGSMGAKLNTASSGGVDVEALAAAVRAALAVELARIDATISSRHQAGVRINSNIVAVNGLNIMGAGTEADPWGPV